MFHRTWYDRRKSFWMVQLVVGWQFSFGIHVDFMRRYVDLHVLWFIFSVGYNAPYSSDFDRNRWDSRGGVIDGDSK